MRPQNVYRALGLTIVCLATTLAASQSSLMYNVVHLGFSSSSTNVGMNRWGDIVGTADASSTAFLYSRGNLTTISPPLSTGSAINDNLEIALYYNSQAYTLYPNNAPTPLGTLGGWMSAPFAINNSGMVVGQSTTPDGQYHPFLYSNGHMTDLGTLGGSIPGCTASGINNTGVIVGECNNAGGFGRAFRVVNGQVADIDARTTDYDSAAFDVNDAGDAVGYSNRATLCLRSTCRGATTNAVIFKNNGTITSIGTLGGTPAYALSINNSGDIVGQSNSPDGTHAFLFTHGLMHDLNNATLSAPGWKLISASAINDAGQIACIGVSPTGQADTVILTPVPVLLTQLTLNPNAVTGGFSTTGTVTVSRPAPPGGIVVQIGTLTSGIQFPAGTMVPISEGAQSANFQINTSPVSQNTTATIWAGYNGIKINKFLTIYNYGL